MAQPYVGEIRMFAGNFPPVGWMFCEGQQMPISENDVLFQLIGTTYGGDGEENFNLPNLAEQETLTTQQIPNHTHPLTASGDQGSDPSPAGKVLATTAGGIKLYYEGGVDGNLNPAAIGAAGGSQPHENTQPFLCINFIISLFGVFPSQT